jgi:hypothetical protein
MGVAKGLTFGEVRSSVAEAEEALERFIAM